MTRYAFLLIALATISASAYGQMTRPLPGDLNPTNAATTDAITGDAATGGISDSTIATAMSKAQQLGFSPEQLAKMKGQLANNEPLTSDQIEELCARIAGKNVDTSEADAMAKAIGLSPEQLAQLKDCAGGPSKSEEKNPDSEKPANKQRKSAEKVSPESEPASAIEQGFDDLGSPIVDSAPRPAPPLRLSQFGYSIFSSSVSTFAPVTNVPVGNDYVIGPGDGLNVLYWGRMNRTVKLKVDRDGSINIPEIGPLQVAGLTFTQAKQLIEGRAGQITGVQVNVTMGDLRTIQVFVMGEVKQPGVYTISSLSHVSSALVAAGGISKVGSLRNIQLRRQNQLVRVIDLYDMLLHGSSSADERLQPQDTIFVPVIGAVAAVVGDVKRPAIYELSAHHEGLRSALELAGGISPFGYGRRVQVERIEEHKRRVALDLDLQALHSQQLEIRDGDLIRVYPVLPQQTNVVELAGNVKRPGKYSWYSGMKVADLVREGEGVAPETYFSYGVIKRVQGADESVHLIPVDLGAALSDPVTASSNISLQPRDEFRVFKRSDVKDLPNVVIAGEVRKPGTYPLEHGMRVTDLIYLAGGTKEDAYLDAAELARTEPVDGSKTRHTYLDLDLHAALAGSDAHNWVLEPNDRLYIRTIPNWHMPYVAMVEGQVLRPGPYTIHQGDRLASLLERCGGMLPDAYPKGAVFIRQSVKNAQEEGLVQARDRLKAELAQFQLRPRQAGEKDGTNKDAELMLAQKMLADSENQHANGRMIVHVRSLDSLEESPENIQLEDHDRLVIPKRPSSINVSGQVYNPTAIVFEPRLTVKDYLRRAGGPTEEADPDRMMVIKADGSVLTDQGVKDDAKADLFPLLSLVSEHSLKQVRLDPGDTIYVPPKLLYTNGLQLTKDITQIIYQGAISLATIGLLAGK